ncbi:MAG: Apea-like [Bacteroidota bacterium]|jgi:hypothetical protein
MKITIPILCNSSYNLTKFDFSFKDITIYDISSKKFKEYIKIQQPEFLKANFNFIKPLLGNINSIHDKRYAIVKNDPKTDFNYKDIVNVWKILLIMFPSDLQIEHELDYQFENNFFQRISKSTVERKITGENSENSLMASDDDIEEINEFIKTVFDSLKLDNYLGFAIDNYLTSYSASHFHYQYLTLCISLENIIYGNQEITYRLRRNVSILCGQDECSCNIIFENLKKLYALRSKIIHGDSYEIKIVIEYLKPIKSIVSRTIIELLVHNFDKIEKLNHRLTEIGFGDRNKISQGWKHYKLNEQTMVEANWKI